MVDRAKAISRISAEARPSYKLELDEREHKKENVWFFRSPKNKQNFVIAGDAAFFFAILAEGNPNVLSYIPKDTPVQAVNRGTTDLVMADLLLNLADGTIEWWEISESEEAFGATPKSRVQKSAAAASGAVYRYKTKGMARAQQVLFDNWLTLVGAINRCAAHSCVKEKSYLTQFFKDEHAQAAVGDLRKLEGFDTALMIGAISEFLQRGILTTELDDKLFSDLSILRVTKR